MIARKLGLEQFQAWAWGWEQVQKMDEDILDLFLLISDAPKFKNEYDADIQYILLRMLQIDPKNRAPAFEAEEFFKHKYNINNFF